MSTEAVIEMKNICKRFGGIDALKNVNLSVKRGTIHALVGENGAGKSTLMKVLTGVLHVDEGEIYLNGNRVELHSYEQSQNSGIAMVPQELDLVDYFTVAENIYLGCEPTNKLTGTVNWKKLYEDAEKLLEELHIKLNPRAKIKDLSVSDQQMVVIARILSKNADVIIMDEPSARLGHGEIENMLEYLSFLREKGKSIIYISHHLAEVFKIAQEVSVLRDGKLVCSKDINDISSAQLVHYMVNRDVDVHKVYLHKHEIGEELLRVEGLAQRNIVKDANFSLHKGEVLGFFGLVGSGRTEMIRAMLGVDKMTSGQVFMKGEPVTFKRVTDSIRSGIVLVPEERRKQGLVLNMSIASNVTMGSLEHFTKFGLVKKKTERQHVARLVDDVNLAYNNIDQKVSELSGGNQQKVVLAKQIGRNNLEVLIFDEPTRGIDVGSKDEIYRLISKIVEGGTSVIIISSEIPELQAICDRIVIMREGRTVASLKRNEFENSDTIMEHAIGG